jgi:hypothetical protein
MHHLVDLMSKCPLCRGDRCASSDQPSLSRREELVELMTKPSRYGRTYKCFPALQSFKSKAHRELSYE